ncbi:MAG: 30S ribosomal protein S16 [Burkholderiaceae bacterium]|jgi:small subunit ribosomal protein S16
MVVVRLSRAGAKKRPFYNIVVTDKRNRRDGSFIERLGFYNPVAPQSERQAMRIDVARVDHWRKQGAQVSPSVERLIRSAGAVASPSGPTDAVAEPAAAAA